MNRKSKHRWCWVVETIQSVENQTKMELAVIVTKEDLSVENEKNEMKMNKNSWQWSGKGDHQ